jgi:hypothetical protein
MMHGIRIRRPAPRAFILLLSLVLSSLAFDSGCGSLEKNAAKDPLKCERDPKCPNRRRANDCYTQCADDPACVDRCREVEVSAGLSGN